MNEDRRKLVAYLRNKVDDGTQYVRSKNVAKDLDLSSKQIGVFLSNHDGEGDITVEKWGRARSTTWKVSRAKNS